MPKVSIQEDATRQPQPLQPAVSSLCVADSPPWVQYTAAVTAAYSASPSSPQELSTPSPDYSRYWSTMCSSLFGLLTDRWMQELWRGLYCCVWRLHWEEDDRILQLQVSAGTLAPASTAVWRHRLGGGGDSEGEQKLQIWIQ